MVVAVDASVDPLPFADCFAAFSARRFCLDAEGAMVVGSEDVQNLQAVRADLNNRSRWRLPNFYA